MLVAALLVVVLAACTSEGGSDEREAPRLAAPTQAQLAEGVHLGDQTDQTLYAVDARAGSAVAVGYSLADNVQQPLIATTSDGGETWRRGSVDPHSVPEETGNSLMSDVAAGEDGFVAVGWTESGPPAVWSSEDGQAWRMHEVDPKVFGPQDWVDAIVWSAGRYYVAGGSSRRAGRATNRPVVWTSEDGEDWRRHDLGSSVRHLRGSVEIADIAVQGDQVLVAGGVEDNANTEQPNAMVLWLSSDGGQTFQRESTREDLGGDYRAYASAAYAAGGAFHVAASGDGVRDEGTESSWDGVVVTQRDGGWATVTDRAMSSPVDEHPSSLFKLDDSWVVATNLSGTNDDARVYTGDSYEALTRVRSPSLARRGEQRVEDGARVEGAQGPVGLLVGSTLRSGSMEPMIWRLDGAELSPVELPDELTAGEPVVRVDSLVRTGSGHVALGGVADSPVAWSSDDFGSWEATGLSGRDDHVPLVSLNDSVRREDGAVIAVGHRSEGNGGDVMVWIRSPDGEWVHKRSEDLFERNDGGYGSTTARAVAIDGEQAVMAANRSINGMQEIHPFFSVDGGESWEEGVGVDYVEPTQSDVFYGYTAYPVFRAPVNGSVSANAVSRIRSGWVLGGERSGPKTGDRPAVWRSSDGKTWMKPRSLPMPPEAHGAAVHHLVTRGRQVVALGSLTDSESDPEPGWVSWISSNGGRTWRVGSVHEDPAVVGDVLVAGDRYLATGAVGDSAVRDARVWSSEDGQVWESLNLDLEHGSGRGRQFVGAAAVDGEQLRLLVADVPPEGGGVHAESVAMPSH